MKKTILSLLAIVCTTVVASAQEYKVVTIVESIVPMGVGRSRIIETQGEADVNKLTTLRKKGQEEKKEKTSRSDAKENGMDLKETKLLNFYSFAGINFSNISANDAIIAAKINEVVKEGWSVAYITSGVESDAGKYDGTGIFITRIFFVKNK